MNQSKPILEPEQEYHPAEPFSYNGFIIKDANNRTLVNFDIPVFIYTGSSNLRNPTHSELGRLFANAPRMRDALVYFLANFEHPTRSTEDIVIHGWGVLIDAVGKDKASELVKAASEKILKERIVS